MGFEGQPSFESDKSPEDIATEAHAEEATKKAREEYDEKLRYANKELGSEVEYSMIMRSRSEKPNFQINGYEIDPEDFNGKGIEIKGFLGKVNEGPEKVAIWIGGGENIEDPKLKQFIRDVQGHAFRDWSTAVAYMRKRYENIKTQK